MNDAVADLYFLVLVHERLADVGIVSVFQRRAADQRRPVGNRFLARGQRKIFASWQYRRGRADRAHRRHVNVLRGQSDQRAG